MRKLARIRPYRSADHDRKLDFSIPSQSKLEAGAESNGVPEKHKLSRFVTAAVTSDELVNDIIFMIVLTEPSNSRVTQIELIDDATTIFMIALVLNH